MMYRVRHVTSYAYTEPVLLAHHQAHLRPRSFARQACHHSGLRITPTPDSLDDRGVDYYGNPVAFFALQDAHSTLTVEVLSKVEVEARQLPDPGATPAWEELVDLPARLGGADLLEIADFCLDSPLVRISDEIADYARPSFAPGRPVLACVIDLTHRVHEDFTYDGTATTIATPLSDVLAQRRGVCQDFAHLTIACIRAMGLPARYVSGYLLTRPPPGRKKLRGSDASHAWLSVHVPGCGWVDFDPTNDCLPDTEHVTLGWGRDYDDVSPLRGVVLGGGEQVLEVGVDVEPV
jgi:transglutaminase-like putative cysteine protease